MSLQSVCSLYQSPEWFYTEPYNTELPTEADTERYKANELQKDDIHTQYVLRELTNRSAFDLQPSLHFLCIGNDF